MNETGACLAITEARPQSQRPGGCVGIFFQLFDWNRRFAKKKLFPKKLLAPARAKQAAKNFGGDEKMPKAKLHLIADENSGGFPNLKKNGICGSDSDRKHEVKSPSLVARLMGLESMPVGSREKPKKLEFVDDGNKCFTGCHNASGEEDLCLEKRNLIKPDSRPQKLQKTGACERQAVTRFGAEAFQIKNVLSRSRKHHHHHHPKLASPVKSPRVSTGRNVSRTRLIDVATRILEPGLQATNRAKCSLTYPGSMSHPREDEVMAEVRMVRSPEHFDESGSNSSEAKFLVGQTACKNCGESLEVVDFRSYEDQQCDFPSSATKFVNVTCQESGMSMPRPPVSFLEQEEDAVLRESRDQSMDNIQTRTGTSRDGKLVPKVAQDGWLLASKQCRAQEDEICTVFKSRTRGQNQMPLRKDEVPSRVKSSNLQGRRVTMAANGVSVPKDFVALNRNVSGRTRPRVPSKMDNRNLDSLRKSCETRDHPLPKLRSPVRKRRTVSVNGNVESTGFARSKLEKERNLRSDTLTRREMQVNSQITHQSSTRSKPYCQGGSNRMDGNNDGDVVSFSFSSPLRKKTGFAGSPAQTSEKRREQNRPISPRTPHQRKLILEGNNEKKCFQEPCPLRGDALSALLEQKLKELTSQGEDELTPGTSLPKRSTAMILQELITALNAEQPFFHDLHTSGTNTPLQAKAKKEGTIPSLHEGDHFSPGSVLEASFSNDSCFSSSMDESSGPRIPPDCMDFSYQHQPLSDAADLSDSATSWNGGNACTEMLSNLLNHISSVLRNMNLTDPTKITHAREVILNTELLFGNAATPNSSITCFLVGPFLLDELARLIHSTRPHYIRSLSFEKSKEGLGLLRDFLSDSIIECLDSRYGRFGSSGFRTWSRLALSVKEGAMIQQIDNEVRKWTRMVGKAPDEIIEWEMSNGLGKWTDFDAEAFEAGEEIDRYILENLVEEIVIGL